MKPRREPPSISGGARRLLSHPGQDLDWASREPGLTPSASLQVAPSAFRPEFAWKHHPGSPRRFRAERGFAGLQKDTRRAAPAVEPGNRPLDSLSHRRTAFLAR
jgi:transposase